MRYGYEYEYEYENIERKEMKSIINNVKDHPVRPLGQRADTESGLRLRQQLRDIKQKVMQTLSSRTTASHCVQILSRRLPGITLPAVVADIHISPVRNVLMPLAVGGLSKRLCTRRESAPLAPVWSVTALNVDIQPALFGVRLCTVL